MESQNKKKIKLTKDEKIELMIQKQLIKKEKAIKERKAKEKLEKAAAKEMEAQREKEIKAKAKAKAKKERDAAKLRDEKLDEKLRKPIKEKIIIEKIEEQKKEEIKKIEDTQIINTPIVGLLGSQSDLLWFANNRDFIKGVALRVFTINNKLSTKLNQYIFKLRNGYVNPNQSNQRKILKDFAKINKEIYKLENLSRSINDTKLIEQFIKFYTEKYDEARMIVEKIFNDEIKIEDKPIETFYEWKLLSGKKYSFMDVMGIQKDKDDFPLFRFRYLNVLAQTMAIDVVLLYSHYGILSKSLFLTLFVNLLESDSMILEKHFNDQALADFEDYLYDQFGKQKPEYFHQVFEKLQNITTMDDKIAQLLMKRNKKMEDFK